MTRPRSTLVSVSDTPWYHVVSRCVRRAFLCGLDAHSCQSFEHRRGWIVERVKQWVTIYYGWRPNLPDEADDHLVELALAGGAAGIVPHTVANPPLRTKEMAVTRAG